jgi:SecD/SecF fusion protein
MLTILGYSINDTVVVYDRIRENRGLMDKKTSFPALVDASVNQSARRTVITTVTTVVALGVMCVVSKLYGLDSIFAFAFPLMTGMLSGVYTSLCVSTSAWVMWNERHSKKSVKH